MLDEREVVGGRVRLGRAPATWRGTLAGRRRRSSIASTSRPVAITNTETIWLKRSRRARGVSSIRRPSIASRPSAVQDQVVAATEPGRNRSQSRRPAARAAAEHGHVPERLVQEHRVEGGGRGSRAAGTPGRRAGPTAACRPAEQLLVELVAEAADRLAERQPRHGAVEERADRPAACAAADDHDRRDARQRRRRRCRARPARSRTAASSTPRARRWPTSRTGRRRAPSGAASTQTHIASTGSPPPRRQDPRRDEHPDQRIRPGRRPGTGGSRRAQIEAAKPAAPARPYATVSRPLRDRLTAGQRTLAPFI